MNTETKTAKTPGRKPLKIKYPQGAFTIAQLRAKNPNAKCELTIRNHVNRGLASGLLVRLSKDVEKGTVGRPNFRFMLKSRAEANARNLAKANAKAKAKTETATA